MADVQVQADVAIARETEERTWCVDCARTRNANCMLCVFPSFVFAFYIVSNNSRGRANTSNTQINNNFYFSNKFERDAI